MGEAVVGDGRGNGRHSGRWWGDSGRWWAVVDGGGQW